MNENVSREIQSDQEDVIDLGKLFYKILVRWRWFIISVPLCLAAALFYCLISTPVYDIHGKVMISDTKKGELGTNVMMKELGFSRAGDVYVENEMVELQSKNLMREVVRDLELNIRYTQECFFRDHELYNDSPVKILVDHPEGIKDTCLYVLLTANEEVVVTDPKGEVIRRGHFSESISMGDYCISVEKNEEYMGRELREVRINLDSYETATKAFYKSLSITPLEKNTNAVRIALKDPVPVRGVELIHALVDRYNQNGVTDKQQVSAKTVEFINARLQVINGELGTIENDAEHFKRTNKLTDLTSDAAFAMERKKLAGTELLKAQTELDVVRSIRLLTEKNEDGEFSLLPENMGLTDDGLNNALSRYNEMILRREKLLLSARENNPIVTGLDMQLRGVKSSIREAIGNVEKGLIIKIKGLERESLSVDERLISVPTQEKQYRAIARQQELKENLFLFLMQKREEAEIAKLVYVPTAKIIEDPDAGEGPVSPKKSLILLLGCMLGVCIPVGIILGIDMLDSKVRSVEDLERVVRLPLLGTFPEVGNGKVKVGEEDFIQSESMQLIREKLNYILKQQKSPVIMVTSTIPGEGKSMVATHLANAYARAGKRVIVVGCDLRNPSLHSFLDFDRQEGLSAYLAGLCDTPEQLIWRVNEELHVLFGGVIPPNPVQLIASPRMQELLEYLRGKYSCIILDTPPLGVLAEGFTLSKLADACVYVVRANVLRKESLRLLSELEKDKRLSDLGVVLNGVKVESGGYGYGYVYGYQYSYGNGNTDRKTS